MNINILLGLPVMGTLSPDTKTTREIICEIFNRRSTKYSEITYVFNRWRGEYIIREGGGLFILSSLKDKLEEKNIEEYKATPVKTSFSEQRRDKEIEERCLPKRAAQLYHFKVAGRAEGAIDDWFKVIDPTECEG